MCRVCDLGFWQQRISLRRRLSSPVLHSGNFRDFAGAVATKKKAPEEVKCSPFGRFANSYSTMHHLMMQTSPPRFT